MFVVKNVDNTIVSIRGGVIVPKGVAGILKKYIYYL